MFSKMSATNNRTPPHVVVMGHVGVGKSTLVSTLTKVEGINSASSKSYTKTSLAYPTKDFVIIDTPGCNPLVNKMEHNLWIASAFNYKPVSLLLVCVEAHVRLDETVDRLREFLVRFGEFQDILCPMITKMDLVSGWTEADLIEALSSEYGINRAVFNRLDKPRKVLSRDILAQCSRRPLDINVNNENFFTYFKVEHNQLRILRKIKELVDRYTVAVNEVERMLPEFPENERVDLVFQFQQFMLDMIHQMKMELADTFEWTMLSPNELGHTANLTNQLKNVLYNVRIMALGYSAKHGVSSLRRCPHCGLVWTKVEGCEGPTTCGNRPSSIREARFTEFATFSFILYPFKLRKTGLRTLKEDEAPKKSAAVGCGGQINWSQMQPVPIPEDFVENEEAISTNDVSVLPSSKTARKQWFEYFNENLQEVRTYKY